MTKHNNKIIAAAGSIVVLLCLCSAVLLVIPSPGEAGGGETAAVAGSTEESNRPTAMATATQARTATQTSTAVPTATNAARPARTARPTATAGATAVSIATGSEQIDGEAALVTRIIDGDTIEVELNGVSRRVRYIGMDTPEIGAPFYREATEANRQLVAGQNVILVKDISETDRYGRLLRYVYLPDGTFVNAELVRQGYAQVATFPPDVKHQELFLSLQGEARTAGLGLWSQTVAQVAPSATPEPQPTAAPTEPPLPTNSPVPQPTSPPPAPTDPPPPPTEPPAAPGSVQITSIFFDGVVTRVESDEYAVITNQGGAAVNLAGWRLNAGDPGQDFFFPAFDLQPGQSCRVYTNESHPETCGFSFASGQAIWNNGGDCGYLFDGSGNQVSQYCY